jgi:hypothetical protein
MLLVVESQEPGCYANHYVSYCVDSRPVALFGTAVALPRWSLFFLIVLCCLVLVFLLRRTLAAILPAGPNRFGLRLRAREALFSAWTCTFLLAVWVWVGTLMAEPNPWGRTFRIVVVLIVLPTIFLLEGLGLALLELRDKEIDHDEEFRDRNQAISITSVFTRDFERYLRAREWFLGTLVIFLTVTVEFETYWVPFFGRIGGTAAHILMTAILVTIAVVWISQAPGKELGRTNPVEFLSLRILLPLHNFVLWLRTLTDRTCIDEPSDVSAEGLRRLLNIRKEHPLGPGGNFFFSELVRRYGYVDCDVVETYEIFNDGSCNFTQTELAYIEPNLKGYRRRFISPVAFVVKPEVTYRGYIVPRLTLDLHTDLAVWRSIMATAEPLQEFTVPLSQSWHDGGKIAVIDITWDIEDHNLSANDAFFFSIRTTGSMGADTFNGPLNPGKDHWSRSLKKPCLRAQTTISLSKDANRAFLTKREFTARQDDRLQPRESARFLALQSKGVENGRTITIDLINGLPGVSYRADWEVRLPTQIEKDVTLSHKEKSANPAL